MCGRYVTEEDSSIDMQKLYSELRLSYPDIQLKSGEIFPTDTVPILCGAKCTPLPGKWGFQGYNKSLIINARAETAAEKPTFRDCLLHRRCVIPTNGYYEWSKSKEKYRFNHFDSPMLYLAGLYRQDSDGIHFVILTTNSNESCNIHPRMPLILPHADIGRWAFDTSAAIQYLSAQMPALVMSAEIS